MGIDPKGLILAYEHLSVTQEEGQAYRSSIGFSIKEAGKNGYWQVTKGT